jgi:hypothetical protein
MQEYFACIFFIFFTVYAHIIENLPIFNTDMKISGESLLVFPQKIYEKDDLIQPYSLYDGLRHCLDKGGFLY